MPLVATNPWMPLAEPLGSVEPQLSNTALVYWYNPYEFT